MRACRRTGRRGARLAPRFILPAIASLVLAACQAPQGIGQGTNPGSNQGSAGPGIQSPAASAAPDQDKSAAAAVAQPKATALAATPASASAVVPPAPVVRLTGDPKELVGLDHTAVRRALGDPAHIRIDRPAQVWQYATGDCIVDLYLYNMNGALTVTYVEARSRTAETAPTGRCLKSLIERPTASAM